MQMNAQGARIWEDLTGVAYAQNSNIAIVLDDIIYSAPGVTRGAISGGRIPNSEITPFEKNETEFGLSSGIITQSLAKAEFFKQNIKSGVATINLPTAGLDYHVPFGGRKASSFGPREQGTYAREFYSQVKTSYINSGPV